MTLIPVDITFKVRVRQIKAESGKRERKVIPSFLSILPSPQELLSNLKQTSIQMELGGVWRTSENLPKPSEKVLQQLSACSDLGWTFQIHADLSSLGNENTKRVTASTGWKPHFPASAKYDNALQETVFVF